MASLKLRNVKVRLAIYFLSIPVLVLYSLILTGCVSNSPGTANIFIGELRSSTNIDTKFRFGYTGMCISNSNETFSCASTFDKSPLSVSTTFATSEVLAKYALDLQHSISIIVPTSAGILFFFALLALLVLKMSLKSQQSSGKAQNAAKKIRFWTGITRLLLSSSTALSLTAAYSITSTVSALHHATVNDSATSVQVGEGKILQVLQWVIFSFSSLFTMSVHAMLRQTGPATFTDDFMPGYPSMQNGPPPPPPSGLY